MRLTSTNWEASSSRDKIRSSNLGEQFSVFPLPSQALILQQDLYKRLLYIQTSGSIQEPGFLNMSSFQDVDNVYADAPPPYTELEGENEEPSAGYCASGVDRPANDDTHSRAATDDDRSITAVYDFSASSEDCPSAVNRVTALDCACASDDSGVVVVYDREVIGANVPYAADGVVSSGEYTTDDFDPRELYAAADDNLKYLWEYVSGVLMGGSERERKRRRSSGAAPDQALSFGTLRESPSPATNKALQNSRVLIDVDEQADWIPHQIFDRARNRA
ncbi:hypothetical protein B0H15DRAFT_805825 [Mycena belliarum]|uniref:Uncharacterized protein n=1 Tax=Mycena belliarum TaxID=1033014 RepID=A0AAD6TT94_9AGAR|nr:hypothetical protein B0H15DRAFT_805825 [Mycena belliae]